MMPFGYNPGALCKGSLVCHPRAYLRGRAFKEAQFYKGPICEVSIISVNEENQCLNHLLKNSNSRFLLIEIFNIMVIARKRL